jgi:hypothetical protein
MLWAWERPEDLRFIDPRETGVAYLAETINIESPRTRVAGTEPFAVQTRRQPLHIPAGTTLMAVARIEMRAAPDEIDTSLIADAIAHLAEIPGVAGIQIDFDATVSQRDFYAGLLRELRKKIPTEMPLSITALASWCLGDAWLDGLPVDEAVPMLFQMGVDDSDIRWRLAHGEDFRSPVCRESEGLSTDEAAPVFSQEQFRGRRIYFFDRQPWTAAVFHDAAKGVRK